MLSVLFSLLVLLAESAFLQNVCFHRPVYVDDSVGNLCIPSKKMEYIDDCGM